MIIELHDKNKIDVSIYNARNILLSCKTKLVRVVDQDGIITELTFSDNFHIELGDLFPLVSKCDTKTLYKVKEIVVLPIDNDRSTFRISCEIINKTSHWLLPFVAKNEEEIGYDIVLRNAYIFTEKEEYDYYKEGYIFLKYSYLKEHDYFLNKLKDHSNCVFVDRLYSRFEYVYIFRIPEQWLNDVNLLIQGKYSKISQEAKKKILNFHKLKVTGDTGKILFKDKDYLLQLQNEFKVDCDFPEYEEKFNINLETIN